AHRRVHARSAGPRRHQRLPRHRRRIAGRAGEKFCQLPHTAGAEMTGYQHYLDAHWASLESLEGLPDVFEPRVKPSERGGVTRGAHDVLDWIGVNAPGTLLAFALAYLGYVISDYVGINKMHYKKSPISPIMLAVVLGLIIRNTVGVPRAYEA